LNISRSRQGQPVIFQAGSSEDGRNFAAAFAEGIYSNAESFDEAQAYYRDIKRRVVAAGRAPEHLVILPGITPVIAETDEAALARDEETFGQLDFGKALVQLGRPFNYYDFSKHAPDEPFPELGELGSNGYRGAAERIKHIAQSERLTLRETAWRFAARRSPFVGSPKTVADELERWFREEAADGFNFRVSSPTDFELFLERVVPLLRERGLFRDEYSASTLRGHLALPVPENRHARARRIAQLSAASAPDTSAQTALP
jgi:alkanesulfonate monooxygenase SsuD/methylene tetrahydromethanopterin reductase-like flavin-dependent oxidoreductase (luciferase family)